MCSGSHLTGLEHEHTDPREKTEKTAVELSVVPKDLKPREQTYVRKYKNILLLSNV